MVIRGKSLLASLGILALLLVSGHLLLNHYISLTQASLEDELAAMVPSVIDSSQQPGAATTEPTKDFFSEHRLERERQRSMQVELLREVINNNNTSADVRQQAQQDWLTLTALMEKELAVEKLVISQGFNDAILVFNEDIAHVVVRSDGLTQAQAVQIMELVASSLKINLEQVRVIERK